MIRWCKSAAMTVSLQLLVTANGISEKSVSKQIQIPDFLLSQPTALHAYLALRQPCGILVLTYSITVLGPALLLCDLIAF